MPAAFMRTASRAGRRHDRGAVCSPVPRVARSESVGRAGPAETARGRGNGALAARWKTRCGASSIALTNSLPRERRARTMWSRPGSVEAVDRGVRTLRANE